MLLKLLLKWYLKKNLDVYKMNSEQSFSKYQFKSKEGIEDVLRERLTALTISYWEAKNDLERAIVKGRTLELKLLLDRHRMAERINDMDVSKENKL